MSRARAVNLSLCSLGFPCSLVEPLLRLMFLMSKIIIENHWIINEKVEISWDCKKICPAIHESGIKGRLKPLQN